MRPIRTILVATALCGAVVSVGAASISAAGVHHGSTTLVDVHVGTAKGVVLGKVTLSYKSGGKTQTQSCSAVSCFLRPPKGVTITASQKPKSSKHAFASWKLINGRNPAKTYKTKTVSFIVKGTGMASLYANYK